MSRKVIAVDFDGTITESPIGDGESKPRLAMIECIREHRESYDFIVIFSARPESERQEVVAFLSEHCIPYDSIVLDKLRYDLLYDDRAVGPGSNDWPRD